MKIYDNTCDDFATRDGYKIDLNEIRDLLKSHPLIAQVEVTI